MSGGHLRRLLLALDDVSQKLEMDCSFWWFLGVGVDALIESYVLDFEGAFAELRFGLFVG